MKTAVITGAAGGLGRSLSALLIARGYHIIALDLDVGVLDKSENMTAIQCDLTSADDMIRVTHQILSSFPALDLVIYNAGITQIGAFEDQDLDSHRKVFEINYFAAVAMVGQLLSAVRKAKGTHLAISSVAGFAPLYHRTSYAASKHALEGFFKSLRSEEKSHGVNVQIAAPSFVATNLGNAQAQENGIARPGSATDGKDYMTSEDAAAVILSGLDKAKPMIPVGRISHIAWRLNRFFPGIYQRLMERQIKGQG